MAIKSIDHPHLILCEGKTDRAFFNHFLETRNIPGFQVLCPDDLEGNKGGIDAMPELLAGLQIPTDDFEKIESLIVVADNDSMPAEQFAKVQGFLQHAAPFGEPPRKLAVPTAPNTLTAGPTPRLAIFMFPAAAQQGGLETLCWQAAQTVNAQRKACVDAFVNCVGANGWDQTKLDKLRLRAFMAASYKRNPDLSYTFLWDDCPEFIPLASNAFDPVENFLRTVNP